MDECVGKIDCFQRHPFQWLEVFQTCPGKRKTADGELLDELQVRQRTAGEVHGHHPLVIHRDPALQASAVEDGMPGRLTQLRVCRQVVADGDGFVQPTLGHHGAMQAVQRRQLSCRSEGGSTQPAGEG